MARLALTCFVVVMAWLPQDAVAQTSTAAVVKAVEGVAQATRQGSAVALHVGDGVLRDDVLTTGTQARLVVTFADGTDITLGPEAEVTIDDFVYAGDAASNNLALRLATGAMRLVSGAIARADEKSIKVGTPVATIGIRGTDFFAEVQQRHLAAALFSGFEITIANAAGVTTLRPGEGADVWDGAAPSHRQTWSTTRINRALAQVTVGSPLPYSRPNAVADTADQALVNGKFKIDLRYRYESVEQANKPEDAYASTTRFRLGYETLAWNGFFGGVEGEFVRDIGGARRSDGVTTQPALPVIPDPNTERLEQAYAGWSTAGTDGSAATRVVLGRQRIAYEDERWIGASDFRQTDQTFDAVAFETRAVKGFDFRYAYVGRINRVLGDNPGGVWSSDSHLIGVATTLVPFGVTTVYSYLLDLRPVPMLSSATTGIRYDGAIETGGIKLGLEAEAARQDNYANNPNQYALGYELVRPSFGWRGTTLYAGWESLGSNGRVAIQTPLATLHAQNGWADVFDTTPVNGLRDLRLRLLQELPDLGPFKNGKLDLRFDSFSASHGDIQYGREFDADINASLKGWLTIGVQFASYRALNFGSNTTKVWTYLEVLY